MSDSKCNMKTIGLIILSVTVFVSLPACTAVVESDHPGSHASATTTTESTHSVHRY